MKLIDVSALVILCIFSQGCRDQWKLYFFCDNKVEMAFPGKPEDLGSTIDSASVGIITSYEYSYKPAKPDPNHSYGFGYSVLPDTIMVIMDGQKIIDQQLAGTMELMETTSIIDNTIDNKYSCQGRKYEVVVNDGLIYGRYYLCGNILFYIMVSTKKEHFDNTNIYKFMDSFKFKKPVGN